MSEVYDRIRKFARETALKGSSGEELKAAIRKHLIENLGELAEELIMQAAEDIVVRSRIQARRAALSIPFQAKPSHLERLVIRANQNYERMMLMPVNGRSDLSLCNATRADLEPAAIALRLRASNALAEADFYMKLSQALKKPDQKVSDVFTEQRLQELWHGIKIAA